MYKICEGYLSRFMFLIVSGFQGYYEKSGPLECFPGPFAHENDFRLAEKSIGTSCSLGQLKSYEYRPQSTCA